MKKRSAGTADSALREHVLYLLRGGGAHVDFEAAVIGLPAAMLGAKPAGAPHTLWQILEHMRIAQWDILEFSRSAAHVSPDFPAGYWPATEAPPASRAWTRSVRAFRADLEAMASLVADPSRDLFARIPHGVGQTLRRVA